jgi:uncharacterized protein
MPSLSARAIPAPIAATSNPGVAMSTAEGQDRRANRWVMVAGHGSVEAAPDIGHVFTGVVTEATTAREALSTNKAALRKVIDGLKAAQVPANDIHTDQFQIQPRYKSYKDRSTQQVEAYVIRSRIEVRVCDLAQLGAILDQIVTLGANEGVGISFSVSNAESLKDEARKKAVENAIHRAQLLAEASGAMLGPVLTITEEVIHPPHLRPTMARAGMPTDNVPVEGGSETLVVRVEVSFLLE